MLPAWAQRISDLLEADPSKTVTGLARACGISQPSVSNWFGKGTPTKMISGDNLVAAASYLGVTPEWIMTGRNMVARGESQTARLDPDTLVITHRVLRDLHKDKAGGRYSLEADPAHFVQMYELRSKLSQELPYADLYEIAKDRLQLDQGAEQNGRTGNGKASLPDEGTSPSNLAGKVRRKKAGS